MINSHSKMKEIWIITDNARLVYNGLIYTHTFPVILTLEHVYSIAIEISAYV